METKAFIEYSKQEIDENYKKMTKFHTFSFSLSF